MSDEAAVRSLIEEWTRAACSKDLDAIMDCYAPDVVAFDAIVKLEFRGVADYRHHWQACLDMAPGDLLWRIGDLNIAVSGDLAFAHYLAHCGGVDEQGQEKGGWMRATVCCRKTADRWRIVHEHYSAPFDPESGKALTELQP
jgi:uncharacterized protein (TIGR02246 family)